jgi:hypothetical protein
MGGLLNMVDDDYLHSGNRYTLPVRRLEMLDHLRLIQRLEWHLQHNFYPPLPFSLVPLAMDAIRQASAGEWDALLTHQDKQLTVRDVIDLLRLEDFITQEVEDDPA